MRRMKKADARRIRRAEKQNVARAKCKPQPSEHRGHYVDMELEVVPGPNGKLGVRLVDTRVMDSDEIYESFGMEPGTEIRSLRDVWNLTRANEAAKAGVGGGEA